jgi:hypothetical protein
LFGTVMPSIVAVLSYDHRDEDDQPGNGACRLNQSFARLYQELSRERGEALTPFLQYYKIAIGIEVFHKANCHEMIRAGRRGDVPRMTSDIPSEVFDNWRSDQ